MRKIKKYFIIILLSIFTLTTVETSSLNFSAYIVQAKASSSTKRKAQEAYRKFLTQRRYRYFTLSNHVLTGNCEMTTVDFLPSLVSRTSKRSRHLSRSRSIRPKSSITRRSSLVSLFR